MFNNNKNNNTKNKSIHTLRSFKANCYKNCFNTFSIYFKHHAASNDTFI